MPMTVRQLNRACHQAADAAGLGMWISPRTLRHSFATHLMGPVSMSALSKFCLGIRNWTRPRGTRTLPPTFCEQSRAHSTA
jgi:integrase